MTLTEELVPVTGETDIRPLVPRESTNVARPSMAARRRARWGVRQTMCAECGSPARELAPGSLTVGLCSPCWRALP